MKKTRLQWMFETELKWFCWQYNDKLRYINQHPNSKKATEYLHDISRIETALHSVTNDATYKSLKKHITNRNTPYEKLGFVPMGRRQFYDMRRRFFEELVKTK